MSPVSRESREQMLKLREFHLQFAFTGAGALCENIQD
jgi:hypothetical protein